MLSYSNRSRASKPINMIDTIVDFEWLTQASIYNKTYSSNNNDFNLSVISLNTGPALVAAESWRTAFNFKLDKIRFGNNAYAEYVGINPIFTYSLNPDLEITFENSTTARSHDQASSQGLDGTMTRWSIDAAKHYTKKQIGIQTGLKYHDNGADSAALHYKGAEFYIGGQMSAWKDARAYLTISTRDYRYKAADGSISTTIKRDETTNKAILGVSHNFRSGALKSWTLNTQYTFTDNTSNLDEFTYDRSVFEVSMRRYFF